MKRIGILSDTHGYWDDRYLKYFEECDEIWHAGDIGTWEVADKLSDFRTFRAVYGNIDSGDIRRFYPRILRWNCEGADVFMKHIGGYPGHYDSSARTYLYANPPKLFICGHSHILRVKYDPTLKMLFINPGAAGTYGIQQVRTLVRLTVDKAEFKDLEVVELK